MLRGDLDSLVEVRAVEDVEADDPLLGLGERTAGDEQLPERTRTVVASSTGRSRSPISRLPRPSTSASQSSMSARGSGAVSGSGSVATNIMYFIGSPRFAD